MDPNIQQLLLAKASQDAEQGPRLSDMVALGAGGASVLGTLAGRGFGGRMAGGLVGAILGGTLGGVAQQSMARETGAAGAMLAKIQAQGGMMPGDEMQLEAILRDAYSQQGLLG